MRIESRGGEPTPPSESRFWNGEDVIVRKYTKISPSSTAIVPIVLPEGSLPAQGDLDYLSFPVIEQIRNLRVATRSRFAQLGLEVKQNAAPMVASQAGNGKRGFEHSVAPRAHVSNYGGRPLIIPEGTKLFAFYRPGQQIIGEDLVKMLGSEIKINGKENREWRYVYKDFRSKTPDNVAGIAVRIEQGERYYIPHDPDPIDVSEIEKADDYRTVLRSKYESVPRDSAVGIWFGTLPQIELSERVAVELDPKIAPTLNVYGESEEEELGGDEPRHIGARLLHPGSGKTRKDHEGWKIKVEIDTRDSIQRNGFVVLRPMWANGSS